MHPDRVCDLSLLPESIRQFTLTNCDCDIDCIFRNVCSCCIDAALQSSATCLSNTLHVESSSNSEEVEIIVIDGCSRNEGYMYFHQYRKLCEDDTGDFSSYFVHYGSATYKNVFCFFCNSNVFRLGQKILHNNFTPLDLNIVCPSFFHFLYTGSINAVINSAKDNGCSVFYDTDKTTKCRKEEEDYSYGGFWASSYYSYYHDYSQSEEKIEIVNICNSSGKVVNDIDLNVRWACENISDQAFPSVSGFKNEFCLLCNVIESVQTLKDKCDPGSFNFHPAYSEGCDLLPDVHAVSEVYPYKNSFCFACNNEFCFENKCFPNSSFVIDPADCSGQTGNALRIRKPFVLPKLLPSVVFYTSPHYVTESERYGCFPGRVLVADICELIIMDGIGLYAVDISTKIMINSTIANATIVLQKIEEALKKDIVKLLPGNPGLMTYFSVVPYNNLNLVTESPVQNEQFLMDIYFEIPYANYERDLIEKMLLKLPHEIDQQNSIENDNVEYYIKGLGFSLPKHTLDYGMSDTISYNKFKNRMQSLFSGPPLSVLFVGNLLFCVHRKFNASLFIFDNENMRITSNESLLSFEMGDFAMDFAGFIGVCDYGSRFNSIASDKLVTAFVDIHYLSTVFHGVSAVSMASIFLSYCIFKNLRTPSGINAMFVSLSLCLLHIVGTLEKLLEHINVACTVIGLILHYLWLSVCCSLTVAAFHQCLLFKNYKPKDDLSSSSKEHSPVLFHIIFSFLLPLVVVATNGILLYVFLTDFQYGSDRCFLTHEISNIITYLSPLAISTLLTIFLHFATFKLIISSKEKLNLKRKRTEFFLLFKVAIIVSVIAFLQISQWFISTSTYSFVVDLIISTQGCTIFLAICCSSQIFKLWKTKGENLSESDSTLSLETEKATTTAYAE
ncbi:uncharacterized protein LOC133188165 [Saccostrea echinata]|uniref:uncharacterized protein LOC133188165 n=1 Tax=Saccostrea echinata TaxID=191078 RepID=UPI002A81992E|nr:uncharacterized protein LOC133188165 [Saccostrea echinata]